MLHITIDSRIHIPLPLDAKNRWPGFMDQIKSDMVLPNPAYEDAVKYDRSTRRIPKNIVLWEYDRNTGVLSLPRGYAGRLLKLLKQYNIPYLLHDKRAVLPPVNFGSRIVLRDYQVPAVDAMLKATQGVLQAPAGSGKTQMGLEVIARVEQPALWLTHTRDLAEQAADRAMQVLGISREEIGMLGAGRESVGPRLTIGIVQKMIQMDLDELAAMWGCVVIDECHHSPASTWSAVINRLPARHRYAVTATFERADGLEVITEKVIGPTLYIISRGRVEAAGGVVIPELRVIRTRCESKAWTRYEEHAAMYREHGWKPPVVPFGDILNEVLGDPDRNRLIIDTLARECPGHFSLVLSERVSHCEELAGWLKTRRPDLRTEVIHGKLSKTRRKEILAAMNAGELDVLFAVDIAKEGLDIPRLDRLFLVAGGRNEAEVEQKVGRIQRPFPGKKDAVVFDFVDDKIGVLRAQHWARRRVYKKLGVKLGREVKSA
ncbi:MAG: DEAD/DEAH box helicase [Desulfofundulus sp.]